MQKDCQSIRKYHEMSSLQSLRTFSRGGIAILAAILLLCGCSAPLTTRHASDEALTPNVIIAVLPFDNYTDQDMVSAKITEYVQTTMTDRRKFTIVERGTTYEALRRLRIRSAALLRKGQIDSLSQAVHADYLLVGSVLEYREIGDKFLEKIPQISINARLIDSKTGNTIWTGVANDSGDRTELVFGLGAIKSIDQLSQRVVESIVRDIEGLFK